MSLREPPPHSSEPTDPQACRSRSGPHWPLPDPSTPPFVPPPHIPALTSPPCVRLCRPAASSGGSSQAEAPQDLELTMEVEAAAQASTVVRGCHVNVQQWCCAQVQRKRGIEVVLWSRALVIPAPATLARWRRPANNRRQDYRWVRPA